MDRNLKTFTKNIFIEFDKDKDNRLNLKEFKEMQEFLNPSLKQLYIDDVNGKMFESFINVAFKDLFEYFQRHFPNE